MCYSQNFIEAVLPVRFGWETENYGGHDVILETLRIKKEKTGKIRFARWKLTGQ